MKISIIAEAGVNHNGSLKLAKKLVDAAKKLMQIMLNFNHLIIKSLRPKMHLKQNIKKIILAKNRHKHLCLKH